MYLLLFFLIRHHLWQYIGKVALTFLFLASQPLPSKAKDASKPCPSSCTSKLRASAEDPFHSHAKSESKKLWRLKVNRASSCCQRYAFLPLLLIKYLALLTKGVSVGEESYPWILIAYDEADSANSSSMVDWWDCPSLRDGQSLSLSASGKQFHLPEFGCLSLHSYPDQKERGGLQFLKIEVSCDLSVLTLKIQGLWLTNWESHPPVLPSSMEEHTMVDPGFMKNF